MSEVDGQKEVSAAFSTSQKGVFFRGSVFSFICFVLFVCYEIGVILPPRLSAPVFVEIMKGMNAQEIARELKSAGIIRSTTLFVWAVHLGNFETRLHAGYFYFDTPLSMPEVAGKLVAGNKEIAVLIPEGFTVKEIRRLLVDEEIARPDDIEEAFLADYSEDFTFLKGQKGLEGYLFPDTYRFFEHTKGNEIITTMLKNFESKAKELESVIRESHRTLADIVIMASILEREAQREEDMRVVAGILWKRLDQKMPLQVDAALTHVTGRGSKELTQSDLASTTPYNTYLYRGLPPSPIANPGLRALRAAALPTLSPYLFYLSGSDGTLYFARTFEEHKKNRVKYLD